MCELKFGIYDYEGVIAIASPQKGGKMKALGFISSIILVGAALVSSVSQAQTCTDPLRNQEVCQSMRHMKSQILGLGAQRDLMQINYPLLKELATEINYVSTNVKDKVRIDDPSHIGGLIAISGMSEELIRQSSANSTESLMVANRIQTQCASCHAKENPASGYNWGKIFKNDWPQFYTKCNEFDRNPYRCKSMHGMFSAYSNFFTASQLGRENFELARLNALEIARIAGDLKEKGIFHEGGLALITEVNQKALSVAKLAEQKDPETFPKALAITESCMQCHSDRNNYMNVNLKVSPFAKVK